MGPRCVLVLVALLAVVHHVTPMRTLYANQPIDMGLNADDVGEPLFLTPLIRDGHLDKAKSLARVGHLNGDNVLSYSGYLTVNETTQSNLFFWFFPALSHSATAPTILWLQGGPGASSLFGLFVEHGPYEVTADQLIRFRNTTWTRQFNMLYIDNPVGAGYSFTKSDSGYVTNEAEVGRDLFEALQQFFTLFGELSTNDFYISGESYAGKYVPAIATTIHQHRNEAKMKFVGMAIGDGLCDPVTMLDYGDFLLQIGLIDKLQWVKFSEDQQKARKLINDGDFVGAFHVFNDLLGVFKNFANESYFERVTGLKFFYNFLLTKAPASYEYYNRFVQTAETRRAIHVGNLTYNGGYVVEKHLLGDIMRSVKPLVAEIMNHYKVMIYNGQLDIVIATPLTASFVNSIEWNGSEQLANTKRVIWRNPKSGDLAGYVRHVGKFTEVLVRNAGHILPYDQPDNAYDMIDRFVNDKPF